MLFILLFFSFTALAETIDYSYPIERKTTSTVTKESFHQVFYTIFGLYAQEISQLEDPVIPLPEWENPYLTAYTARVEGVIKLGFWGGMARIDGMNDEAVALITCHEIGHVLGGEPYIAIDRPMYKNISSEGQADYFATKNCLKRYYNYLIGNDRDELEKRVKKGVLGFGEVLKILKPKGGPFDLNTQAIETVSETLFNSYPSNQCRVDTFLAGLKSNPRPRCWYAGLKFNATKVSKHIESPCLHQYQSRI